MTVTGTVQTPVVGVKTPAVRWLENDLLRAGSDAYFLQWVSGEAIGRRIVRNPELEAARGKLPTELAQTLAKLHTITSTTSLPFAPPAQGPARAALDDLRKMLDLCNAAGGWSVLLSKVGDEKSYEASCNSIVQCCDEASSKQIAIVLKPHGGTTGTGPQLRDCVKRINHKCFTLMYDPGNIFYYSQGKIDPVEDSQSVQGLVTGISVKDFKAPNEVMFTPGTGKVNFSVLINGLRKTGFTHGPLMIEALTPGDLPHTLAEAKKAKLFVESLVAKV